MNWFGVFKKTLRDQAVVATAWGISLVILGYVHVAMYPQYKDASSALSQTSWYQTLAGEAGGVGTPGGYLTAEYFTGVPIMVLIFGIVAASGLITVEETSGTLDLLLAQPIRRSTVVLAKASALLVLVLLVSVASVPGLYLGKLTVGFDLSLGRMIEACLATVPITSFYVALALLGSAALPSRTWTTVFTIGAAIAGFFLNVFGAFVGELDQVRQISPFYWTNYGRVIAHGTDWSRDAYFLITTAAVLALATWLFSRRDISGSRSFRLGRFERLRRRAPGLVAVRSGRLAVTRKVLRDQRTAIVAWGSAVFILALVHVVIYPPFHDAFKAFDDAGSFQPLAGKAGGISSPAGYLTVEFFSYVPLLILIAMVIAATAVVAGDEAAGTLDLVMAQPVSRRRLLSEKILALFIELSVIVLAAVPGLLLGRALVDLELGTWHLIGAALSMLPLAGLYLCLAVLFSVALPNRTAATIAVVGAAIVGYFVNTLGAFVEGLEHVRQLSPFYWVDYSAVLVSNVDWLPIAALLGLGTAASALAILAFDRRDVSSGPPKLWPWSGQRNSAAVKSIAAQERVDD